MGFVLLMVALLIVLIPSMYSIYQLMETKKKLKDK
jgi:hypothetical protein